MPSPHDWLRRPFAHRGLHDLAGGVVENTAGAVRAAVAAGYGIEVDLRLAACGTVMVFHDAGLSRLTIADGPMSARSRVELQAIPFRIGNDRMLSLAELLALVEGRVPMLLEIKAETPGDARIVGATIREMLGYRGPFAVMSFDPRLILAFRRTAPEIVRGLVAERFVDGREWPGLPRWQRLRLRLLLDAFRTRPDFIAFDIDGLPDAGPLVARHLFGRPLLTWTVRTPEQRRRAARWADAIIFEGFRPPPTSAI
jgi:glycerophosphoryl diester phosphodiesterase